jgi:hypothetical protein
VVSTERPGYPSIHRLAAIRNQRGSQGSTIGGQTQTRPVLNLAATDHKRINKTDHGSYDHPIKETVDTPINPFPSYFRGIKAASS